MKINKISLNEIRKVYANNTDGFIIRIRDEKKELNKNKTCQDIVYYNGIKAFFIQNSLCDNNHVEISIPSNIYKLNKTNFTNLKKKKSGDIDTRITNFINEFVTVRKNMSPYFDISILGGKLKFSKSYFKDTFDSKGRILTHFEDVQSLALKRLNLLEKELIKLGTSMNLDEVKTHLNQKDLNENSEIEFTLKDIDKLSIEKLVEVEAKFILYLAFTKKDDLTLIHDKKTGFKLPEMKLNFKYKDIDESKLNDFNLALIQAIDDYEKYTKEELEKKYQHQFLLSNKFQDNCFVNSIPFEEEYYTFESDGKNSNDKDRGRIDCIFLEPKNEKSNVYLIELKVNENVIGKVHEEEIVSKKNNDSDENGINTHLHDINNLISDKNNLDNFLDNLANRYNYHNEILNDKLTEYNFKDANIYFYIIVAITKQDMERHAKKIYKKIKDLKEFDATIKILNKNNNLNILDNSNYSYLNMYNNSKCEIKLLFDIWDKNNISNDKLFTIEEFKSKFKLKN